jgi:hypothetical protein
MVGKDERDSHFKISMIKSGVRIGACIWGLWMIEVMLVGFLLAEILGIYEEL